MTDTPSSEQKERAAADAQVLSPHLPEGYSAAPDAVSSSGQDHAHGAVGSQSSAQEDSLNLQGGDMHRDLFRIDAKARMVKRAATFSGPSRSRPSTGAPELGGELTAEEQRAPGGFRRQFLLRQHERLSSVTVPVTRNFVDFLALYGSFAGEDLAETDDEEDESAVQSAEEDGDDATETRPLLGRRKSTKRQQKAGDAGLVKSFFTLLKAFIGTGTELFFVGGTLLGLANGASTMQASCFCPKLSTMAAFSSPRLRC